jgi:preprotein translocase subunit SecB
MSEQGGQNAEGQGQLRMLQLYLKDASFESPHTPGVFGEPWKPEFQLDINTRSNRLGDDRFEVVLSATLKATVEGGRTGFIVEVQHAGVFQVVGIADAALQRVLGTVCPATLFPYVRETVDSLVVKGGFPAVHLAPVNFDALFAEAVRKQQEASGDTRH